MPNRLAGIRQQLRAVKRLIDTGIVDLGQPGVTLQTAKNAKVYGPQATMAIQGARKYPALPAIVDERGTFTYREVDDDSTALARGLKGMGVGAGSTVGVLCRDHRGFIIAMAACGKLGSRFVLMNTGFGKAQFAQICERENVQALLYDSGFGDLIEALPADLPRVLTWVDDGTDLPAGAQTVDDIIGANSSEPLPAPAKFGGSVILTSGTTGLPKGAPRDKVSPLATVEVVDRVPFPRKGTMVIVSPIFHGTGLATYLIGASLGNKVVVTRRFNAQSTLQLIADHKADMLVAVPTMLHRMVGLGPDVLAGYDTSSLKVIASAGSALSLELSNRVQDTFGDVLYNIYASENGLPFVDGRDDDMIVSGGENVFPQEVENLLVERDDVADAAVVGVDDCEFGKRLRAFIVLVPGAPQDAAEIKLYVKNSLARHKVPRDVMFIDELPRNPTGKLLRRVLVEMAVEG